MSSTPTEGPSNHSKPSAFRRVLYNLHAIFWSHLLGRLGSLLVVPLFLRHWSPTYYGEYLTIFSVVGYLATLDFGFSQAIVNRLTLLYSKQEMASYSFLLRSSLMVQLILTAIVTAALVVLLPLVDLPALLSFKAVPGPQATLATLMLGTYVLLLIPWRVFSGLYQSMGLTYRAQWAMNFQVVGGLILTVTALQLGGGIVWMASFPLGLLLLVSIYVWNDLRRRHPDIAPTIGPWSVKALHGLAVPSLMFALLLVTSLLWFQGTVVIVALKFGGAGVAVFSVCRTLAMLIRSGIDAVGTATWAEIGRLRASEQMDRLRVVFRQNYAFSIIVAVSLGSVIWTTGGHFIMVWTSGRIVPDENLLRFLVLLHISQAIWQTGYPFVAADNRHQRFTFYYLASSIIGVVSAWFLADRFGIWGVPLGALLGEMLGNAHFILRQTTRAVAQPYLAFAARAWAVLIVTFAIDVYVVGELVKLVRPLIPQMMVAGITALTIAFICVWSLGLNREDRQELGRRLRFPRFLVVTA